MSFFALPIPQSEAELEALVREYAASLATFTTDDRANHVFLFADTVLAPSHPDIAWQLITRATAFASEAHLGVIGASALETLLSQHSATYVPLAEQQALIDPRFRVALGHVWRSNMAPEWWQRLHSFVASHPEWQQQKTEA